MKTKDAAPEGMLRSGYTTGTCAAGAAKAAARMLYTGRTDVHEIRITVPRGDVLYLPIEYVEAGDGFVTCAVRKDSGDDPDVTDGVLVYASVARTMDEGVRIEGGEGIGTVTKPGLDQPVGNAAINSVPRKMIAEAVTEEFHDPSGHAAVTISIPEGRKLAEKTFNPRLGIVGGISVLGTSGIVEPMSDDAMRGTIRAEVSVRRAEGWPVIPICPGNYGQDFLRRTFGFLAEDPVLSSNYAADTMEICADAGVRKVLFAGHLGKLVKVAGGVRNTHSRYGDHRMEILAQLAEPYMSERYRSSCSTDGIFPSDWKQTLLDCAAVDEAVRLLGEWQVKDTVLHDVTDAVRTQLQAFSHERVRTEVILFSNVYGILGKTEGAEDFLSELMKWKQEKGI